ncbi:MAG TPA: DNA-3-methyladenine glycosylase 2 [Candidatus Thermoplasmatota archaeon]|nr:DNA-3-methyladenine glycosylase 2 [Candidatus Thermoplasmatota archaeon]
MRGHLRLADPFDRIRARLSSDPALAPSIAAYPGLRLTKNDPWETLVNFLTSMAKSVREIEHCTERLAASFGPPIEKATSIRAFPPAERLARAPEARLRTLTGMGFRARYVSAAARAVARGDVDLSALERATYEEAVESLQALDGVGRKVADCVALYGLGRLEAFPVDTHVRRVVERRFFGGRKRRDEEVVAWAQERWGTMAGYAQQWLFHAERLSRAGGRIVDSTRPPERASPRAV